MNIPVMVLLGILVIAFVLFVIMRNKKDRRELEEQLKNDYRKPRDEEGDTDSEPTMK